MAIEGEVLTAIIAGGTGVASATVSALATWWIARRGTAATAKQLEAERSGEHKIAELDHASKFRDQVLGELESVRQDNKAMRSELVEHEARCEHKIREAVAAGELECEESTNRKLRHQAAAIRREYEPRINELERAMRDISEPLNDPRDFK